MKYIRFDVKIMDLCSTNNIDNAIKEIIMHVSILTYKNQFYKISDDLLSLELTNLPDAILIALLRCTFSIKNQIPCWRSLLDQVEQILITRGSDCKKLLRGLT